MMSIDVRLRRRTQFHATFQMRLENYMKNETLMPYALCRSTY